MSRVTTALRLAGYTTLGAAAFIVLLSSGYTVTGAGDTVLVRGVGNSGNTFVSRPSARRLERVLNIATDLPQVTKESLQAMLLAVQTRAERGEVDAVHFMIELADAQRAQLNAKATGAR